MLEITLAKELVELKEKVNKLEKEINHIKNKEHGCTVEIKQLNLRVDSFWRLRNGIKSFISTSDLNDKSNEGLPFGGVIINFTDDNHLQWWSDCGKYCGNENEDPFDIIEEWKDE